MAGAPNIPIGVSSSSASSSISSASQSISFNPVITLASPESDISNSPRNEQTQSNDARSTTEARSTTRMAGEGLFGGGGGGDAEGGYTGFGPLLSLASGGRTAGGGPATLRGDLVAGGGGAQASGLTTWLLLGGLALAAYFVARRFA